MLTCTHTHKKSDSKLFPRGRIQQPKKSSTCTCVSVTPQKQQQQQRCTHSALLHIAANEREQTSPPSAARHSAAECLLHALACCSTRAVWYCVYTRGSLSFTHFHSCFMRPKRATSSQFNFACPLNSHLKCVMKLQCLLFDDCN